MKKILLLSMLLLFGSYSYAANWQKCGNLSSIDIDNIRYSNEGNPIVWMKAKNDPYNPTYYIMEMEFDYINNRVYSYNVYQFSNGVSNHYNLQGMPTEIQPGSTGNATYDAFQYVKKYKK